MIALYIIAGIIIFILILLIIPVTVEMAYAKEISISFKYLFIKYALPLGKKEEDEEKQEEEKEKKDTKETVKDIWATVKPILNKILEIIKDFGPKDFLKLFARILFSTGKTLYSIIRKIRIKHLDIYYVAGGKEPNMVASEYGQACTFIYPGVAELVNLTKCKDYAVSVDADYNLQTTDMIVEFNFSIRPIFLVKYALRLVFKIITAPQLRKYIINKRRGFKNERQKSK